jgi:hypothetical protein
VHRAYGLLPNMSWVLVRGGTIRYKAMWTSADRIGDFLGRPLAGPARFHTEQLETRNVDRDGFQRGLERNGPKAVTEFARAEEIWAARARAASR